MKDSKIKKIKLKSNMKTYYIYSLSDPNSNEIKYVGCSLNVMSRYRQHIYAAKNGSKDKDKWIKNLLSDGIKPVLNVLDNIITDNRTEALNLEAEYIKKYRDNNLNIQSVGLKAIEIVIDVDKFKKLEIYCMHEKISLSKIIDDALESYVEKNKMKMKSYLKIDKDIDKKIEELRKIIK